MLLWPKLANDGFTAIQLLQPKLVNWRFLPKMPIGFALKNAIENEIVLVNCRDAFTRFKPLYLFYTTQYQIRILPAHTNSNGYLF